MALSDKKILESMKEGSIIIEPFKKANLATSSYDVTLGEYFFPEQTPPHFENLYNVYDKKHIERVWGTKAKRAKRFGDAALALAPDDADRLSAAERHGDEVAVGQGLARRHPVIVGAARSGRQRQRQQHGDALARLVAGGLGLSLPGAGS